MFNGNTSVLTSALKYANLMNSYVSFTTTLQNATITSLVNSASDYISKGTSFSIILENLINAYSNTPSNSF